MIKKIIKFFIFLTLTPLLLNSADLNSTEEKLTQPDFDKFWNYSDPGATEAIFQNIYNEQKGTASSAYLAQLLSQLARAKGLQGNFEDGFNTIKLAEEFCKKDDILSSIRILLEKGRLYNSSGEKADSREFFWEAKELAIAEGYDLYAIDAVHMLGIVDPPEKQLEWNLIAIEMAEKTEDQRAKGWLGPLLNNTGWSYFDLGNYETAMELFNKSLNWREQTKDELGIRIAKWTIARNLRALERYDEAISIQLELEKEIEAKELPKDGYVYEELGELYLVKGDFNVSKKYFGLAYSILSEDNWLQNNEPDRLSRLKELSK